MRPPYLAENPCTLSFTNQSITLETGVEANKLHTVLQMYSRENIATVPELQSQETNAQPPEPLGSAALRLSLLATRL